MKGRNDYMKLKEEFISHNTDKESLLVAAGGAGFTGIVKGNKTLGAILDLLREDRSREEIVKAMHERFEAPEGVIEKDVDKAIANLQKIGALIQNRKETLGFGEYKRLKKRDRSKTNFC